MKKIILPVLFILLMLSGCESQSNDKDNPIPDHEDNNMQMTTAEPTD